MKVSLPPEIPADHRWTVALWDVTEAELARRGYPVRQDTDDLDSYHFVEFEDPEIGDILLLHHDQSSMGFDIMVRADVLTCEALDAIARNFGIESADLQWVAPYPHFPGTMGELLPEGERSLARRNWASGS